MSSFSAHRRRSHASRPRAHLAVLLLSMAAAACDAVPPCPTADLGELSRTPRYAVVTSDYQSTAIALLDEDGALVTEAWVDSGSERPGLVTALSGDVVLPTASLAPRTLTLLDRFHVDVLTRISLDERRVLGQTQLQPRDLEGETAFSSNPQDAALLDDGRIVVSRLNPNPRADAPAFARGNDLVVLDPVTYALGEEIDLSAANDVADDGTVIAARPTRLVRRGAHVVVGLGRMDADYRRAGEGAVAVWNAQTSRLAVTRLEGLANCGLVAADLDDASAAWVLCAGDILSDLATRRARAGIVQIRITSEGRAEVSSIWRAREHADAPVPGFALESIGGGRVVYSEIADGNGSDRLAWLDGATGETHEVLRSGGAFTLFQPAFDAARGLLLVPDSTAGVRRLHVDAREVRSLDVVDPSPCRHLGAVQIRPIAP